MAIETPDVGTYTVEITAKVLTESVNQAVSVVITSGGSVTSSALSSVDTSFVTNELSCGSGFQMVTVNLMDRGGDGWGNNNDYEIRDMEDNSLVESGDLNGDVGEDSYLTHSICLEEGKSYDISLIRDGSSSKDMTLDIPQCSVHLSKYTESAVLDLTTAGSCNRCDAFLLEIVLIGPSEPIPYGWKDDSVYLLQNSSNFTVGEGTLATGVLSKHKFCLQNDVYRLEFNSVPNNDDFLQGQDMSEGIDQYRIALSNCGEGRNNDDQFDDKLFPLPLIRDGDAFLININGNVCSFDLTSDLSEDDDAGYSRSDVTLLAMLLGLAVSIILAI